MNNKTYTKRAVRYDGRRSVAELPLGGIGTGTLTLDCKGRIKDIEIFNRPAKDLTPPYNFFSIYARAAGEEGRAMILERRLTPPYSQARGYHPGRVAGLPRFAHSAMRIEYPFAYVELQDESMPVSVDLKAFNPFVPLDADASGIPAVVFRYEVTNRTEKPVDVTVCGSFCNTLMNRGFDAFDNFLTEPKNRNEYFDAGAFRGIAFSTAEEFRGELKYGTLALTTREQNVTHKATWLHRGWWDGAEDFWRDFSADGLLEAESHYAADGKTGGPDGYRVGSLGVCKTIAPHASETFEFAFSWCIPNRIRCWCEDAPVEENGTVRNYYAVKFGDAKGAASYLWERLDRLESLSEAFREALFTSAYDRSVIEAFASTLSVLRSTTCFRLEDGRFLSYEGSHERVGSCDGNCTHVWNYAQTMAYFFPEFECSCREIEFNLETDEQGKMTFRTRKVFDDLPFDAFPALDGQLGTIIRLYRDWKISGDTGFLRSMFAKASAAFRFVFEYYAFDEDGLLSDRHHNTYDIEFYGATPLANVLLVAACRCYVAMCAALGKNGEEEKYLQFAEKLSKIIDEKLFNGRYYEQKIADVDEKVYQFGRGCLSDQLLGQFLAYMADLGDILDPAHIRSAVRSVYEYNFKRSFADVPNVQRTFALNDEQGLVLCSWPFGGRPKQPFTYAEEVWTGVEYEVASLLVYQGFVKEAVALVRAVRRRYDGYKRTPYNDVECGNYYARSLSSFGLIKALSGFRCDNVAGTMSFDPVVRKNDFRTFYINGREWGVYEQKKTGGVLQKRCTVLFRKE